MGIDLNEAMIGINLIIVSLAMIALICGLFYFVFGDLRRKVSGSERGDEAYQQNIAQAIQEAFKNIPVSENPGQATTARRDTLLIKFRANELSKAEAVELGDILTEEKKAAQQRKDFATLALIVIGLALLASILAKK